MTRHRRTFAAPAIFSTRRNGSRSTGSASAPVGEHTSPTIFGIAILGNDDGFNPVSLVCKLSEVDGRPAVKLSDNYQKAMGPPAEIERYRRIFGTAGVENVPVTV